MQPLNKTKAEQSHRARMQAEQTVMPRPHLRCGLAWLLFGSASSFETGSDRQKGLNRGGYRDVGELRRGRFGKSASWIGVQRGRKHGVGGLLQAFLIERAIPPST
jgi:hypothetical protein